MNKPKIFLDCDGVLADFDAQACVALGVDHRVFEDSYGEDEFWRRLRAQPAPGFFRSMLPMPDARELVEGVEHLAPVILTGAPLARYPEAQSEKIAWAAEHFPNVPIIVCQARDKRLHAVPGDVLIDDRPGHAHLWRAIGGIFIEHKNAADSLAQLWALHPELEKND